MHRLWLGALPTVQLTHLSVLAEGYRGKSSGAPGSFFMLPVSVFSGDSNLFRGDPQPWAGSYRYWKLRKGEMQPVLGLRES